MIFDGFGDFRKSWEEDNLMGKKMDTNKDQRAGGLQGRVRGGSYR